MKAFFCPDAAPQFLAFVLAAACVLTWPAEGHEMSASRSTTRSEKSLRLANGNRYRIVETQAPESPCQGRGHEGFEEPINRTIRGVPSDPDRFAGSARSAAKTSVTKAQLERFDGLDDLLTTLPTDAYMQALNISSGRYSGRVKEERRNVSIKALLIAFKKETGDNDYHLIVGERRADNSLLLLNSEISGLPAQRQAKPLKAARATFEHTLKLALISSGYTVFADGIPVRITGSLFFDTEHTIGSGGGGLVGPGACKAATAWEIHPITRIVFEPVE